MKILVIGLNGQLGSDCMSVVGSKATVSGVDFPEMDISKKSCSRKLLDRLRPEVIVNCAAYTAVDSCENDSMCWKVNADGPAHLAKWASGNGVFLVHVSSDYVFDGKKPFPAAYVETDLPAPVSEYGKSKLAGEQAVLESGADAAILRTAWLYGAKGGNFLKTMLRLTLQNPGGQIKVVNDQYGSPTWSRTLARQIAAMVEARSTGLFHATSEGYCTWFELACTFMEELGVGHKFIPCSTGEFPALSRRPANSILGNVRAKELGVNIFKDWKIELQGFVERCGNDVLKEAHAL